MTMRRACAKSYRSRLIAPTAVGAWSRRILCQLRSHIEYICMCCFDDAINDCVQVAIELVKTDAQKVSMLIRRVQLTRGYCARHEHAHTGEWLIAMQTVIGEGTNLTDGVRMRYRRVCEHRDDRGRNRKSKMSPSGAINSRLHARTDANT